MKGTAMKRFLVLALSLAGLIVPPAAHADVSFDTGTGSNSEVTVGDSDVPSVFRIMNNTDAGPASLTGAKLTPACKGFGFPCADEEAMVSLFDPGVMELGAIGTGRAGGGRPGGWVHLGRWARRG